MVAESRRVLSRTNREPRSGGRAADVRRAPSQPAPVANVGVVGAPLTALPGVQASIGNRGVQRLLSRPRTDTAAARVLPASNASAVALLSRRGGVGAVQPPAAGVIGQASSTINRSLIQMKRTMVVKPTQTRIRKGDLTGDAKNDLKAVTGGSRGTKYKRADQLDLSEHGHMRGPGGDVAWYRVNPPTKREYITSDAVMAGFSGANEFDPRKKGGESEGGAGWGAAGGIAEIANAADDPAVEWARKLELEKQGWEAANPGMDASTTQGAPQGASTELSRAEGGLWLTGGLFGMAVSMKDLVSDDKSAWERVDAAINFMGSGMAATGALAQIASTHMEEGSAGQELASGTSAWALGYQEMFTGLSAGVKTIKGVVDIVKMIADENKHSVAEWVQATGALLKSGLETAKGVLRTIRQISETLGGAVTEQFAQVLPGLDIAIAAVKSIVQGYYLVVSAIGWHQMATQKKELLKESGHDKGKVEEARKAYRHDSARIAQLDSMVREKDAKIAQAKKAKAKEKDPKKKQRLDEKIAALEKKKKMYEDSRRSASIDSDITEADQMAKGGPSRGDVQEYDLASVLETSNQHRVVRQATHITANLVQIAASIASLVSGPGAPAAIALKAAAAGIDMSLPFFRWVKQRGRDAAARNAAKGEKGVSNKIFNADKSDAAKLADRKKQAVSMLKMIAGLNPLIEQAKQGKAGAKPALANHKVRIELYLSASGVDTNKLYSLNGKPSEQVMLMVKAIAQRELDE